MEPVRLVLATSRRATYAFFTHLAGSAPALFAVSLLPVTAKALAQHVEDLAAASLVAIDVSHHPDAAVQFCQAVRKRRQELPLLALVCCTHPALRPDVSAPACGRGAQLY